MQQMHIFRQDSSSHSLGAGIPFKCDVNLREKKDEGGEEAHIRLLEAWQAPEPMQRPNAILFINFALSFLAHADAALLQSLLPIR